MGASAAVPLLCFAVIKHGTVLISGADVNPANLEQVKPAPQCCKESVAATPAPQPSPRTPTTPTERPREEKRSGSSTLQRASNFSRKAVADNGPERSGAQLKTFLTMVTFQTLQAEVGMRKLGTPRVESFPGGTLFPGWVPGSDTLQGHHPKRSGLRLLFHKADTQYEPPYWSGLMQGRVLCCPHQTLITPLTPPRLGLLWGTQGRKKGLGCILARRSPQQLPLHQEKHRAAAGIAKHSPALCLRLVFANVTRVQE